MQLIKTLLTDDNQKVSKGSHIVFEYHGISYLECIKSVHDTYFESLRGQYYSYNEMLNCHKIS